ncbi:hypothetical protein [Kordiimonas sp. UBA4487]|nr:hypothetical protein [Kordiimonas sp. UBA4487]
MIAHKRDLGAICIIAMMPLIKLISQHFAAVVLFAFVAMITDLAGLYEAVAVDDTNTPVMTGCHSTETPADWEHDEPCDPDSILPCHMCAVLDPMIASVSPDDHEALNPAALAALEDTLTTSDPDPPKPSLL